MNPKIQELLDTFSTSEAEDELETLIIWESKGTTADNKRLQAAVIYLLKRVNALEQEVHRLKLKHKPLNK